MAKKKQQQEEEKPDGERSWRVPEAIAARFEEIVSEAQKRIDEVQAEMRGRLNEWGYMAKDDAGVPEELRGRAYYDVDTAEFKVMDEPSAPPPDNRMSEGDQE